MKDEEIIKILELIGSDNKECCRVGIILFYQNKLDLQKERILKFNDFILNIDYRYQAIRTGECVTHWFSPYYGYVYYLTNELDITNIIKQIINERT